MRVCLAAKQKKKGHANANVLKSIFSKRQSNQKIQTVYNLIKCERTRFQKLLINFHHPNNPQSKMFALLLKKTQLFH
jgi:hypothetical protein